MAIGRRPSRALITILGVVLIASVMVRAQAPAQGAGQAPAQAGPGQQFQFFISVSDAEGKPVTDLTSQDVVMTENGVPNEIVRLDPHKLPVELTIAVDNGPRSQDALAHYRSGLTAMIKALPADIEVTLITTSPQPRSLVKDMLDRERILRAINGFAPESDAPRFTDTIVEFAKRYEDELKQKKIADSIPVLMMISTTANEASSYELPEVQRSVNFLAQRRAKVHVMMVAQRDSVSDFTRINDNRQAMIALPLVKGTGGKFEPLAISNRLVTLLPELGEEIGKLHNRNAHQFRVTVNRKVTGPLQNPSIQIGRPGLTGAVSLEGYLP